MKPTEKAKSLVEKFERSLGPNAGVVAAELCCDEIISSYQQTIKDKDLYAHQPSIELSAKDTIRFWQQVKEEIQKL